MNADDAHGGEEYGMSGVIEFHVRQPPKRQHVLAWLLLNYRQWPYWMDEDIGPDLFHGWRFIRCTDGEIVFSNCVQAGITDEDFYNVFEYDGWDTV